MDLMSDFWAACQAKLQELTRTTKGIYKNWFEPIEPISWDPATGQLTLQAPAAKVPYIRQYYLDNIRGVASYINHNKTVQVTLIAAVAKPDEPKAEASPLSQDPAERVIAERARREASGLIPRFTFEEYVSGSANQLAVAAAQHVAATPGQSYNPLYIYGGVGLGKTHLMHAVGHRYLDLHPNGRVRAVTAQNFINEYTSAVRESASKGPSVLEAFDERYRDLDLLLIDDVQSLSGAKGSQAQFFRAFEALVPHNKQIVITSDTYSKGLKDIEPRLVSRLSQGLSVAIEPPEYEMRVAILQNKARDMGISLPDEVSAFIGKRIKSNVRELEGALQQVVAYQQFQAGGSAEITIDLVKKVLRDQLLVANAQISIEGIQKVVADYYKIKVADMHSKKRPASIAKPRQIAMYIVKQLTNHSLSEIGDGFGGRDHATVLHGIRKIEKERQQDAELNHEIHVLEQMIRS